MDFKPIILDNLDRFRGIVREPDRIESINVLLNEIYYRGFTRLIDNFCSQKNDANKAYDTLFEIWICKMLLENPEMQDLQYEPSDENRPPDFRCRLENVKFDVQIKRLLNVHNEMAKSSLYDECLKRLERIPRPWFINYGVSKDFNRQDINPFFEHIKKELENFKIISTMERVPLSPMYSWPDDKNPLVGFTFSEKPKKENNYISPGMIYSDSDGVGGTFADIVPIRKAVRRVLNKAKASLRNAVTDFQSNLVVLKVTGELWVDEEDMLNILYGDEGFGVVTTQDGVEDVEILRATNGLFRNNAFSTICGVIFVSQRTTILDQTVKGVYFPNPMHLEKIKRHPKILLDIPFRFPCTDGKISN